jgi:hypothetical protein
VKVVVRAVCALLLAAPFFFWNSSASAQVTAVAPVTVLPQYNHRWELYGGGQYSHFNPSPARGIAATNLEGWNGTATVFMRPAWGWQVSGRGLYGSMSVPPNPYNVPASPKMSEYLFLFGPTFRIIRGQTWGAGFHTLFGAAYGTFDKDFPTGVQPNQVNIYNTKVAFGAAVGWFTDYNISSRLAIRGIADYQPTHYGYTGQNEFAGSLGVVFKFGQIIK